MWGRFQKMCRIKQQATISTNKSEWIHGQTAQTHRPAGVFGETENSAQALSNCLWCLDSKHMLTLGSKQCRNSTFWGAALMSVSPTAKMKVLKDWNQWVQVIGCSPGRARNGAGGGSPISAILVSKCYIW